MSFRNSVYIYILYMYVGALGALAPPSPCTPNTIPPYTPVVSTSLRRGSCDADQRSAASLLPFLFRILPPFLPPVPAAPPAWVRMTSSLGIRLDHGGVYEGLDHCLSFHITTGGGGSLTPLFHTTTEGGDERPSPWGGGGGGPRDAATISHVYILVCFVVFL